MSLLAKNTKTITAIEVYWISLFTPGSWSSGSGITSMEELLLLLFLGRGTWATGSWPAVSKVIRSVTVMACSRVASLCRTNSSTLDVICRLALIADTGLFDGPGRESWNGNALKEKGYYPKLEGHIFLSILASLSACIDHFLDLPNQDEVLVLQLPSVVSWSSSAPQGYHLRLSSCFHHSDHHRMDIA